MGDGGGGGARVAECWFWGAVLDLRREGGGRTVRRDELEGLWRGLIVERGARVRCARGEGGHDGLASLSLSSFDFLDIQVENILTTAPPTALMSLFPRRCSTSGVKMRVSLYPASFNRSSRVSYMWDVPRRWSNGRGLPWSSRS